MSNGTTNRIEVTTFYKSNDCIVYNLVLHENDQEYYCSYRYSQLFEFYKRLQAAIVKNSENRLNVAFPPKNYLHYFKYFKSEKDQFIRQRLSELKKFFEVVSSNYTFDQTVIRDFVDRGKRQHYELLKSPKLRPMRMAEVNVTKMKYQFIVV